ncbi:MAG: AmmeMemoRadiSam system protein A [bacterium]
MTTPRHPLAELAQRAIEEFVKSGRKLQAPEDYRNDPPSGVFVSLKKSEKLRGCIGTITPATENLGQEIIENAISAAVRDSRFSPVSDEELDDLEITVDILTEPELVQDASLLDEKRYGIIVKSGGKRGVLLPDLSGVDSVSRQLEIARKKAGIGHDESFEIYRFEVKRYR